MLYCNVCGQSPYISEDRFIEYADISGSEIRYLNPDNGDVEDYGDTDTESSGDSSHECPQCGSDNIEFDSDVTEEDALAQRTIYSSIQAELRKTQEKQRKKNEAEEEIKKTGWDLIENEISN